jgi:hypothetical protein
MVGKPDGRRLFRRYMFRCVDIGIRIFMMWDRGGAWTGFVWFRIVTFGWSL